MLPSALPNLSPLQYGRANDLVREVVAAKTYAEMYPTSAAPINTFLAAGGSQGAPLPTEFSALGADALNVPSGVSVGGTVTLTLPTPHSIVNGVYNAAPSGVTVSLAPGPNGQAGYPGSVTIVGNVVTGATEGLALFRVDLRSGPAGASNTLVTYSRYYSIEVAGEA